MFLPRSGAGKPSLLGLPYILNWEYSQLLGSNIFITKNKNPEQSGFLFTNYIALFPGFRYY